MRWTGLMLIFGAELPFILSAMGEFVWLYGTGFKKGKSLRSAADLWRAFQMVMGIGMMAVGIVFLAIPSQQADNTATNWWGILIIVLGVFALALSRLNLKAIYDWGQNAVVDKVEGLTDNSVFYARFDRIHRIYLVVLGNGLIVAGFLVTFGVIA